jgi:carotenoid cleavage dioxygenase
MNAHRNGDDVVIDVCRLPKVFDNSSLGPPPLLHRWTVNTAGPSLTLRDEVLSERVADFPSIDRRRAGLAYRYGFRTELSNESDTPAFGGVVRHDTRTGGEVRWSPGRSKSSGEWLFVASGPAETEGSLISFVHDRATDTTELVILDARDVGSGPLATVVLPQRVPYGFHAAWVPAAEI